MSNFTRSNASGWKTSRPRAGIAATVLSFLFLSLVSCASNDQKPSRDSAWIKQHQLYDGNDSALFLDSEFKDEGQDDSEKDPPSKEEFIASGDVAWQAGDMERALYEYLRALRLDDGDNTIYFKIGRIYDLKNEISLAETAYQRSIEIDPDYLPAIERLGTMQLKRRDYGAAENSFRRAIELDQARLMGKDTGKAKRHRATSSGDPALDEPVAAGEPSDKLQQRADQQSPFYAYIGMGVLQDLSGNTTAAQQYYAVAKRIAPDTPIVYNNIGYSHYLANSLPLAEKYFRQAINLDPDYVAAWRNLALVYVRKQDYAKALNILVSKFNNESSAYNMVGYLCMLDTRYELAESFFQKAIAASPVYYKAANENLKRNRELLARVGS